MASDPPFRGRPSLRAGGEDEGEATRITSLASLESELRTRRQQVHAYLVVLQGTNVGEMHKVDGPETIIGRAMNVNVRLNDDGISRRHCRVLQIGGQVIIEDLQSANGTVVNNEIVTQRTLKDGDKIRAGLVDMTFHVTQS